MRPAARLPLLPRYEQVRGQNLDVLAWTEGRALVATGNTFSPSLIGELRILMGEGINGHAPDLADDAILDRVEG